MNGTLAALGSLSDFKELRDGVRFAQTHGQAALVSRSASRVRGVVRVRTPLANAILDNVDARSPASVSPTLPGRPVSQPTSGCGLEGD
jgi:hypothetical protein